jgi:hypothetical protein
MTGASHERGHARCSAGNKRWFGSIKSEIHAKSSRLGMTMQRPRRATIATRKNIEAWPQEPYPVPAENEHGPLQKALQRPVSHSA